jgi:hypothetical protein
MAPLTKKNIQGFSEAEDILDFWAMAMWSDSGVSTSKNYPKPKKPLFS